MSERDISDNDRDPEDTDPTEEQCKLEFEEKWEDIEYLIRKPFCCK